MTAWALIARCRLAWRVLLHGLPAENDVGIHPAWTREAVRDLVVRAERVLGLPDGWFEAMDSADRVSLAVAGRDLAQRQLLVADVAGIAHTHLAHEWAAVEAGQWPV